MSILNYRPDTCACSVRIEENLETTGEVTVLERYRSCPEHTNISLENLWAVFYEETQRKERVRDALEALDSFLSEEVVERGRNIGPRIRHLFRFYYDGDRKLHFNLGSLPDELKQKITRYINKTYPNGNIIYHG